jgi:hypothetical protein
MRTAPIISETPSESADQALRNKATEIKAATELNLLGASDICQELKSR